MELIALAALCSVSVSVLLKLAVRWQLDVRQLIAGGYLVAASLTFVWLKPNPLALLNNPPPAAWVIFLALGILLPSLFLVLANSVRQVGIVLTDAAQRLSLLVPVLAAFVWFGEAFNWLKGAGLVLGLVAIVAIIWRSPAAHSVDTHPAAAKAWRWPLMVFIGMGAIDILFKQLAQLAHLPFADLLFAVFMLALLLSCLYVAWLFKQGKAQWAGRNLLGALALGSLNFGNILFYIKAHQQLAQDPALVFASMNIGVIVLGTLVGLCFFKERLERLNLFGLGLAVGAVAVLSWAY